MNKAAALVWCCALLAGCADGPVPIERGAACASCRMTISSQRFAAEIVAPGEEPRLYDDIGCLLDGIRRGDLRSSGEAATAYVADHRTGAWFEARDAVYTRAPSIDTPMGSRLIAHADDSSRAADPDAAGGLRLTSREVLPEGTERSGHAGQ